MAPLSSTELGDWEELIYRFRDLAENFHLHGLLFQHLELCARRAWFHMNRIDYAHLDERMRLGVVSHEIHRPRDHSVTGLIGVAPDRIDWDQRQVIEAKGSAGARKAVSMQTRFYALLLMAATGQRWSAANEIIGGRKQLTVAIARHHIQAMVVMAEQLAVLADSNLPPPATRKPVCNTCSYRFLCGFE
ncbi:Dna2/Cas4 domain-containing protein [Ectothiorhodospira haloalkaliphila]|uniref:CRISPR-associated protein Cas4 n=1 Tax=Ectothiorhodospira haloalkaliphila TaxID=421628 RepID=UPI001EE8C2C0|nr:Dna2/Cas4 domain-containing protein [Ectothiorhodospira haloalkaliphila]MCG5525952.1 Dna2/Cas4 domain-containing protein [Ectothiorhodospira haloalkaliphila]